MIKYQVVSDSMTPLIPVGAELVVEKLAPSDKLSKFDIIVFFQDNKLICHYVWHINVYFDQDLIVTRSLKQNKEDRPFERRMLMGRVINYKISFFRKVWILFKNRKA